MGCGFSRRCRPPPTFNTIRLVHLNGYVEDFDHPISVNEIIGNPPKQFLCTAAQLVSAGGSKPLKPDTQLQPGHIYFLLPLSTLQNDMSPLDMASVARRLTARAKSIRSDAVSPRTSPSCRSRREITNGLGNSCRARARARARAWKPILDTIREISFTRRSESDLREIQFITKK